MKTQRDQWQWGDEIPSQHVARVVHEAEQPKPTGLVDQFERPLVQRREQLGFALKGKTPAG